MYRITIPKIAALVALPLLTAQLGFAQEAEEVPVAPTLEELVNTTYKGVYDDPIELKDGVYEGPPFEEGGASRPRVELARELLITGDVNGDGNEESVVFLSESSGGSGTQLFLAVVGRIDEAITNLGTALVGDRVQVRDARISGKSIELDVVQGGKEDAACCPSEKSTRTWTLRRNRLREGRAKKTGKLSIEDLAGPIWVLTRLGDDKTLPKEPQVTLVFEGDRVTGMGGCNRYFTKARPGGMPGDLTVGPIGSTRRACPELIMDLEMRYFKALQGTMRFGFFVGQLVLNVKVDNSYETMFFKPTEPPKEETEEDKKP
jgi:heat shock protein HslJ